MKYLMDDTCAGSERPVKGLVRRYGSLLHYPGLCDCLNSARSQMNCTSSQKNSQTGQGLGPRSSYRVVRGSIDQVRYTGTRKINLGRSSEAYL